MNHKKIILAGLIGVLLGGLVAIAGRTALNFASNFFGRPKVTLINATGEDISHITIILGTAKEQMPDLKDGQARTAKISGHFGECSTRVSWTDSIGSHDENAGGYMENFGFYHERVVLTPDRKAKAIYEIQNNKYFPED
jgi:hypothetical protein